MFRYEQEKFDGLPIEKFVKALDAEGIPSTLGYSPLNTRKYLKNTLQSRAYRRLYTQKELAQLEERNHCPVNDRLCRELLWFYQNELLGTRADTDQIVEAIHKVRNSAGVLAKA
jgi:dTDP-4-amino-4,6-dideoxygalactose transaminase